jgi:hypothetical protein
MTCTPLHLFMLPCDPVVLVICPSSGSVQVLSVCTSTPGDTRETTSSSRVFLLTSRVVSAAKATTASSIVPCALPFLIKVTHSAGAECWESNPGPRKGGTRAREKDCRSYDLQPVKGKERILYSCGTRGNAESLKKQISFSPHFFKII